MSGTRIESNHSDSMSGNVGAGIGGGIAIVGSVAFINTSVITDNTASMKGGGIAVTDDTDNNSSSLVKLQDIIQTDPPRAIHIGQNSGGDIAGNVTATGTTLQILDDTSIDNLGDPPGSYLPQKFTNYYLGIANINGFCLNKGGSYGKISTKVDKSLTDIMFTCFDQSNDVTGPDISGQTICQSQYSASLGINTVIDRMANYYDPTSLQCYKNLKRLGPIGQGSFARYCSRQQQYTGLFDNSPYRQTAYDWLCQPKDASRLPNGLSVTNACNLQYDVKDAIDRLANYNSINGWECWEPA